MNLFCPSCDAAYTGATNCPHCGSRLITPAEAFVVPYGLTTSPPDLIRPTAATRIVVGTVAGFGLLLAFQDFGSAIITISTETTPQWWSTPLGVSVGVALRIIAAAIGGLLSGAGRANGTVTGLITGVVLASITHALLDLDPSPRKSMEVVACTAMVVIATATGLVGSLRWPPSRELQPIGRRSTKGSTLERFAEQHEKNIEDIAPPTRWARIVFAATLAVLGVTFADDVRIQLKLLFQGAGQLGNPASEGLIDLGLAACFLLGAGLVAGAGAAAGGRHGLITGVITTFGVVFYTANRGDAALLPVTTLLEGLGVSTNIYAADSFLIVAGWIIGTGTIAGWIGGELLPPLAPRNTLMAKPSRRS